MPRKQKNNTENIEEPNDSLHLKRERRGVKGDPKVTNDEISDALTRSGGLISPVVDRFAKDGIKITRQAIQQRIKSSKGLREVKDDGRERLKDEAEYGLRKAVRDGEAWAICFVLKCLGKDRGYIERQQIEAKVEADVNVEPVRHVFNYPNHGRLDNGGQN